MSFHQSAAEIWLDGHVLKAKLTNSSGEQVDAEIDLIPILGNDNGRFQWGGENYWETSRHNNFTLEGDENVPILRAELSNLDGDYVPSDVNLAERIGNEDGSFVFN